MSASHQRVAVAALALLVLAPLALAQENATLSVRLTPATVSVAVGQNISSTITVENDGLSPMTVALSASNVTGNLSVTISEPSVTVLPGTSESAAITVRGSVVGDWRVTVVAQQETTLGSNGTARATAELRVLVGAPSPPPSNATNGTNATPTPTPTPTPPPTPSPSPAPSSPTPSPSPTPDPTPSPAPADPARPRANVSELTLAAPRGERVSFSIAIENPGPVAQHIDAVLRLPLGWGGSLDRAAFDVGANDRAVMRGFVAPNAQAEDAEGELVFTGAGGVETVRLWLVIIDAPTVTSSGMQPAAPQPPAPAISENVAPPAPAREEETILLSVEPREIAAAPGTHVVLNLHVRNLGATPMAGEATFEAFGLPIDAASPMFLAPARGEAILTFIARIPDDAPQGTRYEGIVRALDREAPFTVHADSVDLSSVAVAPVSAADGGTPAWVAIGVAGAAAGTLSLAALARKWPLLGLAPLYARLAPRRALEHPRRQQLVDLLRNEPGATLADVQRKLGLSNGVARHHVQLLEAAGMVRVVQDGPLRRLYPTDAPRAEPTPALRERALTAIRRRGEVRASELAVELGVSRQALHYHLKKLEREGAIVAAREGTEVVLAAAS